MSNKSEIERLQAEIDKLKKQEQDKLIANMAPKYVGKYFKTGMKSYIHITEVTHVTENSPNINVRANGFILKIRGVLIETDCEWCVNTECLIEISESAFKQILNESITELTNKL